MGCDIHAYVEIEVNGEWRYKTSVEIDRDYELFTVMAGVGSHRAPDYDTVIEPRGMPGLLDTKILNDIVRYGHADFSMTDHVASWLTYSELNRCQLAYMAHGNEPNLDLSYICAMMDELDKRVGEVRLVFWFEG